jgi:hypothetical protein
MKSLANFFFVLILSALSLSSCSDSESEGDAKHDNKALFNEIQTSLVTRNISVEEFLEMTTNAEGTPQFFREFEDLSFEEFSENNARMSNQDMHDKLMSLQEKLNAHKTNPEN